MYFWLQVLGHLSSLILSMAKDLLQTLLCQKFNPAVHYPEISIAYFLVTRFTVSSPLYAHGIAVFDFFDVSPCDENFIIIKLHMSSVQPKNRKIKFWFSKNINTISFMIYDGSELECQ